MCNNFLDFTSIHSFDNHNDNHNNKNKLNLYPKPIIHKMMYNPMITIFSELANGDLKTFLPNHYNNKEMLENTVSQIFMALIFFYNETKCSHNDCHWGNFLYHKVNKGGYYHYRIYGKDYYIKNMGYLWVSWDYGYVKQLDNNFNMDSDFIRISHSFKNKNNNGWLDNNYKYPDDFTNNFQYLYLKQFHNPIQGIPITNNYSPNNFIIYITNLLELLDKLDYIQNNIPENSFIINKNRPFTI